MLPPALPPAPHTLHRTTCADRGDSSLLSAQDIQIRYSCKFDDDHITVVLDSSAEDWHVDAKPEYGFIQMAALLDRVYSMGFEAMEADECEPEVLRDGSVRIYFVPVGA